MEIKFNIPYITGSEKDFINESIKSRRIAGDGPFTKKCQEWFQSKFSFKKVFLTTSCTDALEMAALLLDIKEGDEVILPAYTFVSTANAFLLRGAKLVFADSKDNQPNINVESIKKLITTKTKVILVMHYAGYACDMEEIMALANAHEIFVIEDAALALGTEHHGKSLGAYGHLSAFSFHETKNISCGEGGMLVVNDARFIKRAEIIREKGTNRSAFFRGEIDKYGWSDIGSSFLPSDILAAYLWAQLQEYDKIISERMRIWSRYFNDLNVLKDKVGLPSNILAHNASIFYLLCNSLEERTELINYAKDQNIALAFHYQALHKSNFSQSLIKLPLAEKYSDTLVRLPLYPDLTEDQQKNIISCVLKFYSTK